MRLFKGTLFLGMFVCALVSMMPAVAKDDTQVDQATRAAEAWLVRVDASDYGAAWDAAAAVFQAGMSKEDWTQAATKARAPLGRVVSRKLASADPTASLPEVPPGKYVVIQYTSDFVGGGRHTETITPVQNDNGEWKVAGYFVN